MVKMDLPNEKEISEEASGISIENEIKHGAEELKALLKNDADMKQILKKAKSVVGSEKLLHKYIRQDSIQIKVFKIDINKSDVINCFDNVVKLVIREQNLSNHAIMTHEGNEKIEHGFYKVMYGQMSLF